MILSLGLGLAFLFALTLAFGLLRRYDGGPLGEVHVPEHHVLDDAPSCLVPLEEFWALHAVQSPLPGLLCEQPVKWLRVLSLQCSLQPVRPTCTIQH